MTAHESPTTPIGTVGAGVLAEVGETGELTVRGRPWSLDWWIGAEDGWHRPAESPTVRQVGLDAAPITETALRVPGGDVFHRAFAAQTSSGAWSGPAVVVEVENRTAVPVALAFVVTGGVHAIDGDGAVVLIDGAPALILDRPPARAVQGPSGTVRNRLAAGDDAPAVVPESDRDGGLEVAVVVALTHTATVRVLVPVPADRLPPSPRPFRRRSRPVAAGPTSHWSAPTAEAVGRGWAAHTEGLARAAVPARGWEQAIEWSERVLAIAGPDEVSAALDHTRVALSSAPSSIRVAEVCEALARTGSVEPLDPIAFALARAQRLGGEVRLGDRSDGTVALLHAAGAVLGGPRGVDRVETLIGPVAKAVHRMAKVGAIGLERSGASALRSLAPVLDLVGQPDVAETARGIAGAAPNATRERAVDQPTVDGAGAGASSVFDRMLAVRALVNDRHGDAVGALDEHIGPRPTTGAGGGAAGFDPAEVAARLDAVLDVLVVETEHGVDLLPGWTPTWYGGSLEVHNVATSWGSVSFAIRWHDDRPALFCQIDPHPGRRADESPRITITSLEPTWVATGWSGDTLLPPVVGQAPRPAGVTVAVGTPVRRRPTG